MNKVSPQAPPDLSGGLGEICFVSIPNGRKKRLKLKSISILNK